MIRLLFFIALVLALGFGFAWLADRPGDLVITWQGRQIEVSLMVAVTAVVSLVAAVMISWWIIRTIITSPHAIRRYFRASKRDRGYQALSTGLIAAGAGDSPTALKMLKRTQGLLNADQEPLLHLLDVQAAMIEGRNDDARKMFESLANDPETKILGLRGLYLEARRQGADEAARHYADEAVKLAPQLPWAADAALSNRTVERNWGEALGLIERQRQEGTFERKDIQRKKAVLLTARAMDVADADPAAARTDGLAALKLAPNFVPAALVAAKSLFREEKLRRGSKLLEAVWRETQHPDIAEAYVHARIGDTPGDEFKRALKLESIRPNNADSLFAVARAALSANKLDLARSKAEAAARLAPREGIFLLLADIEEADSGDQGRVRYWLSQALKAPRDPAWTADGFVSEEWAPVSPVTGRLDAFEWKVPVAQLGGPTIEHGTTEAAFNNTVAGLPPVAIVPMKVEEPAKKADRNSDEVKTGGTAAIVEDVSEEVILPATKTDKSEAQIKSAGSLEPKAENSAEKAEFASAGAKSSSEKKADIEEKAVKEPAPKAADVVADDAAKLAALAEGLVDKAAPAKSESEPDPAEDENAANEKEAAFLSHRPDDPGVDETAEPEPKGRFRLF